MKKVIIAICLMLLGLMPTVKASGVPAPPYPIEVTLPDGSTLIIRLIGDERGHKKYTVDGWQILQGEDEYYYYVTEEKDGTVTMTATKAHNAQDRRRREKKFLKKKGIFRELPKPREE